MGSLLAQVCAEASLLDAWQDVRENDLDDGVPNPQLLDHERGVLGRIHDLAVALRAGTWQPHAVYARETPKPAGGTRLLAVPHIEDRIVERAVLAVLDDVIDPLLLPWSFAYRRGLGVKDALHALAAARDDGRPWLVRADIADCFEEIPRWPVLERLRAHLPDGDLCLLISHLINRGGVGPAAKRIRAGRGLHQGSALSPVLTNLYLDAFDRALLRAGHRVLRDSDDFAIPVPDRRTGQAALALAVEALKELELRLNTDKSEILAFDEGVQFLGKITAASSGTRGTSSPRRWKAPCTSPNPAASCAPAVAAFG